MYFLGLIATGSLPGFDAKKRGKAPSAGEVFMIKLDVASGFYYIHRDGNKLAKIINFMGIYRYLHKEAPCLVRVREVVGTLYDEMADFEGEGELL